MPRFRLKTFLTTALAVGLAGCAANPMTGRSQLSLMPESQVIAQASQAYAAELEPWRKKGKVDTDPAQVERVRGITNRLVYQAIRYRPDTAHWAWQVTVIDDPKTLNAFCLPGGRMAIYSGMMDKLKASDDEIAQVMGHEIAHALANHGAERMSQGMLGDILVAAVGGSRGRQQGAQLATLVFWQLPNSRANESEADRIGIEIAARAGYDPAAAPSLWRKMAEANGGKGGLEFLSTHPAPKDRMATLEGLVPDMRPLYAEARAGPLYSHDRLASNVRDVSPGAAPPPTSLKPLSLISPAFERFKRGEAVLECTDCALSFGNRQDRLRELRTQGQWEALAREVLDLDYSQDIAWFYLGEAAAALGHVPAARRYFEQAVSLAGRRETHCRGTFSDLCGGVQLPEAAQAALKALP
jgi:predicted Zn-dependent protease